MLHWHEEIQFVAVQKGVVHFKIWEKEYELSEGSCMFINCNVLHHISEKQDCSYHSFLIPPKMLGFFKGSAMAVSYTHLRWTDKKVKYVLVEFKNP